MRTKLYWIPTQSDSTGLMVQYSWPRTLLTQSAREHTRATDLVERNRFIDTFPFFWSFAVGTTQSDGSLAAVQDLFQVFTSDSIAYSPVQQWMTPDFTDICGHISGKHGRPNQALDNRTPVEGVTNP